MGVRVVPRPLRGRDRRLHRPRLQHVRLAHRGVHLRHPVRPSDVPLGETSMAESVVRTGGGDARVLRRDVLLAIPDRHDRHLPDLLHPARVHAVPRPHPEPNAARFIRDVDSAGHRAWTWHRIEMDRPRCLGEHRLPARGQGDQAACRRTHWHARQSDLDLGNPWIWWTSLPCVLSLPYFIIRHRSFPATVILIGFITQYLPWSHISRVLFMYHMFGGLIFMILALAFVLAHIPTISRPPARPLRAAHLGTAAPFFFYFYPVWTGLPLTISAYDPGPGSPIWGPKMWLVACQPYLKGTEEKLWCWN